MVEVTPQLRAERILDGAVNTTLIGFGYVMSVLLVVYGFTGRDGNCILAIPCGIVNGFFWVGTSIVLADYVETTKKDIAKTYHVAQRSTIISALATLVCLFWLGAVIAASCSTALIIILTALLIVSAAFTIFWAYIQHLLRESVSKEGVECHQ